MGYTAQICSLPVSGLDLISKVKCYLEFRMILYRGTLTGLSTDIFVVWKEGMLAVILQQS